MVRETQPTILDLYKFDSVAGTEIRRLLYNVTRPIMGVVPRSILVTSAVTGEGKSTIAALLAITAAHHCKHRTLLIDSDLRRPAIHRMFNMENALGFADLLTEPAGFDTALRSTPMENLWVIPAGNTAGNPTEMIREDRVRAVVERAKLNFDLVILDCPPIIPVSDPAIMSSAVEGIALVIRAGKTQREVVERARDIICKVGATIIGIILNNVQSALPYHYASKSYGHYYLHDK
jgi:capsular exopolysaccharide synthesis family protein